MRREHTTEYIRPPLPSTYRQVNYLKSYNYNANRLPYINTNYYSSNNTSVTIKWYYESSDGWLFGARSGHVSVANDCIGFCYNSSMYPNVNCWPQFGNASGNEILNPSLYIRTEVELIINNTGAYLNGNILQDTQFNTNQWNALYPIWLFNLNNAGQPNIGSQNCRIYYCQIFENNVIQRDMVPVVRNSDNKPGMWDFCQSICPLTNSPFYVKAGGSGEFSWA